MKKFLKVVGIILSVIIVIIAVAFVLTINVASSADNFFSLIKANKLQEAYNSTAQKFQSTVSYEDFTKFIDKSSIGKFESYSWGSRSFSGNRGSVKGYVTTAQKSIPVELDFVKENGEWKVLYVDATGTDATSSGVADQSISKTVPSDADIIKLVQTTMGDFASAVASKDFTNFYQATANLWKTQISAKELQANFQSFIDKKVKFSFDASTLPTLSEKPSIDGVKILHVDGYYPSKDINVIFSLEYIYEYPNWKLVGIRVKF